MGFRSNAVSFNKMMKGRLQKGEWDEARNVFDEMLEREIEPTVITYYCQIGFWSKKGKFAEAKSLFDEMIRKGNGEFDDGLKILNTMLMSRHCARLETFCCLIVGLVNNGKMDDAYIVMEEMVKRRMAPNLGSWEALVMSTCGDDKSSCSLAAELVSSSG
ncbi:pentatricopeptide repeat-containing protein At1g07740, mitochondrial-like [Cynara cardunculus var. scolymus]|uniref:pentatricopeptide repeat-containing protein At1g07740, mitochondrial-like n=1 Tax=Cynara cardunculus var. scolymus TaxID=59895 RepID=UPI000D628B83|nr:pentatricopeptide repeat-containing protein At1g07740, mitochondrial-like [Cynara cardunculus var. scolymus]